MTVAPGESVKIPTGVRVEMEEGWVLSIFPRSSLGFKYRLQLNNTVGIIDSDYFYSDNEGHMFIKMTNDSREGKRWSWPQEWPLPRVFSSPMVSRWTTIAQARATAASAARMRGRK